MNNFTPTEDDYQLEEERATAGRIKGFERNVKQRERLELSAQTSVQPIVSDAIFSVSETIAAAILAEENKGRGDKLEWYPYLRNLEPEVLSMLAIRTCLDAVGKQLSRANTCVSMGRAVDNQIYASLAGDAFENFHPRGRKAFNAIHKKAKETASDYARRVKIIKSRVGKANLVVGHDEWTDSECFKIGIFLLHCVFLGCDLFEDYEVRTGATVQTTSTRVGLAREIRTLIDERNLRLDWNAPAFRPMVVPPVHWGTPDHFGPYHDLETALRTPLVKNARSIQKRRVKDALKQGTMQECLDAVNTLGDVAFKINRYTLDAIKWVAESLVDEDVTDFPPLTPPIIPEKTDENATGREAQKRYRLIKRERLVEASHAQIEADMKEIDSLCDHMDRVFYLPHNFDFRGRVYAIPAFNYQRSDYIRGLHLFADAKPITQENHHHLYYQLANTWANPISDDDKRKTDKVSLDERYQWVKDNIDALLKAGEDYVVGFEHWSKAGDPVQHLAACRELYMYNKHGDGYLCGLPIARDGSNSGLQHYAMASKNHEDAYKVCLVPDEQPQDIYSFIAEASTQKAQSIVAGECDTIDGREVTADDIHNCQLWLDYGITRSVTKRNTMTWSYSVTLIGMADQLRDEVMSDITAHSDDTGTEHPFGDDCGWKACFTLASLNKDSIESVIQSGASGMDFLRRVAKILADDGKHMVWTSLIGFPVCQQYHNELSERLSGFCFDRAAQKKKRKRGTVITMLDPLHKGDSISGVAPNFIHHADSVHLMTAVNKSKEYGVTNFMVIHDSFATDIENVDTMLECVQATMVEMYAEQCLYTNFLDEAKSLVDDPDAHEWPEIPPKGDYDVWSVMDSKYAFA